jgi:hypothetical protein
MLRQGDLHEASDHALAKKCFPTLAAFSLSLLLVQAARADLVIKVTISPPEQTVREGAAGKVDFFILNESSNPIFVDTSSEFEGSSTPMTADCPLISGDATDKIICSGELGASTTGRFLPPNEKLVGLGTTIKTNLLDVSVDFTTSTLDNGPLKDGKNAIELSFYAAQNHAGDTLTNPEKFDCGILFCTVKPATVYVSDTPEPSTLASMLVPIGLTGFLLYRVRVKERSSLTARPGDISSVPDGVGESLDRNRVPL